MFTSYLQHKVPKEELIKLKGSKYKVGDALHKCVANKMHFCFCNPAEIAHPRESLMMVLRQTYNFHAL